MKKWFCCALCCLTLFSLSVYASDEAPDEEPGALGLSLGDLLNMDVTSVAFFAMETEKAPGFVQNFLMEDINTSSVRTLGDLVDSHVVGMVYGMNEAMGALIGSRGVLIDNNAKTLVMLDSQQLHARSHGYSDWFMTPFLGDFQSIEVVNGPGAIVHGSGAINGYFNLIPKNGSDNSGFTGNIEYGEFENLAKLEVGYGFSYGSEKDLYIYGGILDADGADDVEDVWSEKPEGKYVRAYGYSRSNFRLASYWRHGDFSMNFFITKINPMTNSDWDQRTYFHHGMVGIRPKYTWHFNETNALEIILSGELHDVGLDDRGSKESHIETKLVYKTLWFDDHRIAVGGLYGKRKFKGKEQYFSTDYEIAYPLNDGKWTEVGLFAEDVITWDRFTFSLGLRWDNLIDNEQVLDPDKGSIYEVPEEGHFSPRIAASYEISDGTVVKASYQQGFRYPDANYYNSVKHINDAIASLGLNDLLPALKPEQMDSYEVGFHKEIEGDTLIFDINLFYNTYKDQLTWSNLDGSLEANTLKKLDKALGWRGAVVNLGDEFTSYGGEFIVNWMPMDYLRLRLGYGYTETTDMDIERYHTHQIKTNIKSSFLDDKLIFDLTTVWNSNLPDSAQRHDVYADDRLVFDLAGQYAITENLKIKAVAKNLFENDTPTTGYSIGQPQLGHFGENERRFYISLNAEL